MKTQDLEANAELKHSAFSRAESAVVPFEGLEGEHAPETDLTRYYQVLEEGDKFESRIMTLDSCCFLALLGVHTLFLHALWNELRLLRSD